MKLKKTFSNLHKSFKIHQSQTEKNMLSYASVTKRDDRYSCRNVIQTCLAILVSAIKDQLTLTKFENKVFNEIHYDTDPDDEYVRYTRERLTSFMTYKPYRQKHDVPDRDYTGLDKIQTSGRLVSSYWDTYGSFFTKPQNRDEDEKLIEDIITKRRIFVALTGNTEEFETSLLHKIIELAIIKLNPDDKTTSVFHQIWKEYDNLNENRTHPFLIITLLLLGKFSSGNENKYGNESNSLIWIQEIKPYHLKYLNIRQTNKGEYARTKPEEIYLKYSDYVSEIIMFDEKEQKITYTNRRIDVSQTKGIEKKVSYYSDKRHVKSLLSM